MFTRIQEYTKRDGSTSYYVTLCQRTRVKDKVVSTDQYIGCISKDDALDTDLRSMFPQLQESEIHNLRDKLIKEIL